MISTKQASEKWGISPRRIAKLASEGRISGARLLGHSWLIPENALKPIDARTNTFEDRYIYPHILMTICNETPLNKLNEEEKDLYQVYMSYEKGEFEAGLNKVNSLLNKTKNIYIKIGCLYLRCYLFTILKKYKEAQNAVLSLFMTCNKVQNHKFELNLFMNDIYFFFVKDATYKSNIPILNSALYTNFDLALLSIQSIIEEINTHDHKKTPINLNVHEINIYRMHKDGFEYMEMFYHYYISLLYAANKYKEQEYYHLKKAIDLAVKNNTYTSIAGIICYFPDSTIKILEEYPKDVKQKFISLIETCSLTFSEYLSYAGKGIQLTKITLEDYKLISYCLREYSIEEIAQLEDISLSKAKHSLVSLYKKLGISKKSELKEKYRSLLL